MRRQRTTAEPETRTPVEQQLTYQLDIAREEVEQLEAGLVTRQKVGIVQGMLMLHYGITADEAFDYLARRAQTEHVKLRELAQLLIDERQGLSWPEV